MAIAATNAPADGAGYNIAPEPSVFGSAASRPRNATRGSDKGRRHHSASGFIAIGVATLAGTPRPVAPAAITTTQSTLAAITAAVRADAREYTWTIQNQFLNGPRYRSRAFSIAW